MDDTRMTWVIVHSNSIVYVDVIEDLALNWMLNRMFFLPKTMQKLLCVCHAVSEPIVRESTILSFATMSYEKSVGGKVLEIIPLQLIHV